jgi:hypothetical protein
MSTQIEDKQITDLMSEKLRPIHSNLMTSFIKQPDKQYLGIERRRYLNLSSLPIFSRVYVIVKLDPIIDSDPSFILLLRKDEETEDSFMVVDSARTIIGCSDYLYQEFPSIRGFINTNLRKPLTFNGSTVRSESESALECLLLGVQRRSTS